MPTITGGDYTSEGLIEVYCNDEWGTICYDFFYTMSSTNSWVTLVLLLITLQSKDS